MTPPQSYEDRPSYIKTEGEAKYAFFKNGLIITYPPPESKHPVIINNGSVLPLGENPRVAQIDFTPNGFMGKKTGADRELSFRERTAILAHGLAGLRAYFDYLDTNPQLEKPALIFGDTNQTMAEFAKRLGFQISENRLKTHPRVYVTYELLKENLENIMQKGEDGKSLGEKIIARAMRKEAAKMVS